MGNITELYWTGNKISRRSLFPTTLNRLSFSPTRILPAQTIESLRASFGDDYQENLRLLFTLSGKVDLATKVYFDHESDYYSDEERLKWLESRGFVPVLNRELAFDLTPNPQDSSQCFAWNNVVRELLIEENKNQHWYLLAEEHFSAMEERISGEFVDTCEVVTQELEAIEKIFPKNSAAVMYEDGTFPGFSYDNPDYLVQGIENLDLMSKLFTYISVGKNIYFGQYINWWNHIQILNVEEVIKYKKRLAKFKINPSLLKENRNLNLAPDHTSDKKEIIEKHIKCFRGERKGHGRLLDSKNYEYLLSKTIELAETALKHELSLFANSNSALFAPAFKESGAKLGDKVSDYFLSILLESLQVQPI
ncbi:MAG: hypothetical protein EOO46_14605 [Flavobacterium sp.]|nr:MAG: hypothetical protein EOO46_14605 [Flavobacterium sp.]